LVEKMEKESKKVGGKATHVLSGRALFSYNPTLFTDDDGAADEQTYEERNEDEIEESKEEDEEDTNEEKKVDKKGEKKTGVDKDLFK
jgi:hypothetical protein